MQIIVNQMNRIGAKWFVPGIVREIEKFSRCNREVTMDEIATAVVDCMKDESEDAYVVPLVDKNGRSISQERQLDSVGLEIRYFDYELDCEVAMIRIGRDAKKNIFIFDAPKVKG